MVDENQITIDGEVYEFDPESVAWDDINQLTNGAILEAKRVDGTLWLTVKRQYTADCTAWDTGEYHEINR